MGKGIFLRLLFFLLLNSRCHAITNGIAIPQIVSELAVFYLAAGGFS